jgi:transposase
MTELPDDWKRFVARLERERDAASGEREAATREREASARRADKLQESLDRLTDLMAKQGQELTSIRKILRRREEQLAKAEREVRKLRRQLGLDDPDPEPHAAAVPPAPSAAAVEPQVGTSTGSSDDPKASADAAGGPDAAPATDPSPETDAPPAEAPPRRTGGRRAPPAHLPTDHERHDVCACPTCGSRVLRRDLETAYVYSVVPTYVRRRKIERARVVCANPACGQATTAPMPPMPCERALFDCGFIAWLVTMKFGYLMPLDRVRQLLLSQGVNIAMGTLVHLIERATDLMAAVDGEHMKQLRKGKYVCFDGTGLKVLMPGQPKAWDGYLEVFTCGETTVFQFDLTKHADELRGRLAGIQGVLVTDAESRNAAGAPDARFGNCNAHVVRKLEEAESVNPDLAGEGLAFLGIFYSLEAEAKKLGLVGDALRAHRQQGLPTLEAFRRWLDHQAGDALPPSDPVGKIARYYLAHWDGLTLFMHDPDIPLDNNEGEREFQRHAKLRLASLFAGSVEGAHRWAMSLGVVRTAQKYGLDLQAYLTWLFERRGTWRARFGMAAEDLTPAAYLAAGCPGSLRQDVPLAA